jgi:hypothetical protein
VRPPPVPGSAQPAQPAGQNALGGPTGTISEKFAIHPPPAALGPETDLPE